MASGRSRQRASGRRRSTPMPLHGASSSTRSNGAGAQRGRAPSADDREEVRQPDAVAGAVDHAHPSGVDVEGDDRAVGRPLARRWPWPSPGRGGEIGDALARFGREHHDHGLAPLVLGGGAAVAHRVEATGVADAAHDHRVGHQPADLDLGARRPQLVGERAGGDPARVGPQRDRGGLVHGRPARHGRRAAPSSVPSRSTSQSGYDSATASSAGSGHGCGNRRERPEVGVDEPTGAR